jgi:hypothetical protein
MLNRKKLFVIPAMLLLLAGVCACSEQAVENLANDQSVVADEETPDEVAQDDGAEVPDEMPVFTERTGSAPKLRELAIQTQNLGNSWFVDHFWSKQLRAGGGSGRYLWEMTGELPEGLAFNGSKIKGTPAPGTEGEYDVTFMVSDKADPSVTREQAYTLKVNPPRASGDASDDGAADAGHMVDAAAELGGPKFSSPGALIAFSLPTVVSAGYSASITLKASGGNGSYKWEQVLADADATWVSDAAAFGENCSAAGSKECLVTFNHIFFQNFDPQADPVRNIAFRVTDGFGRSSLKTTKAKILYPKDASKTTRAWHVIVKISKDEAWVGDTYFFRFYNGMVEVEGGDRVRPGDEIATASLEIGANPDSTESAENGQTLYNYVVEMKPTPGHATKEFLSIKDVGLLHQSGHTVGDCTSVGDAAKTPEAYRGYGKLYDGLEITNDYWHFKLDGNADGYRTPSGIWPSNENGPACEKFIEDAKDDYGIYGTWILGSHWNDIVGGMLFYRMNPFAPDLPDGVVQTGSDVRTHGCDSASDPNC